jgi:hypothetical protein
MTTSPETDWMSHAVLRKLVREANELTVAERLTLLKALIPALAEEMSPRDFEALIVELRLKGERYYDATNHPGVGRAGRSVMGERDVERR